MCLLAESMAGESYNVAVPKKGPKGICGYYMHSRHRDWLVLYPSSWKSKACYNKSPMLVLSHEMLHQIGMPPHFDKDSSDYYNIDPIETTMTKCIGEARAEGRPIYW